MTSNSFQQPTGQQVNIGISQSLTRVFAIHIDGVYNRTRYDYKTRDINPADPVSGIRPLPEWGRIDQTQSVSDLKYSAIYTKLEKRFSRRNQFMVSYTWTKSRDNAPLADSSIRSIPRSTGDRRTASAATRSLRAGRSCSRGT